MQPKKQRNKLIVELIGKGWSMRQVAKEMGMNSPATVHEIYWREKNRASNKPVKDVRSYPQEELA